MRTYNFENIITSNSVLSANKTSKAMQLWNMIGYSIQIVVTGTPTGTFSLLGSCDPVQSVGADYEPTNFSVITNSSYAISAAGNYLWNVIDPMYNWVELYYQDTSGGTSTAILTVSTFNAKGF
jgi:hypothetical protein